MKSSSICTALSSAATQLQSATKIMGETAIWTILCFYPVPLLTMLRNNDQKLFQAMLWVRNIIQGKRGNFKHTFRNSHYIFTLIVWNLQKEKFFQVIIIWNLLKKGYYKHTVTNVAVWIGCDVYVFAILSYRTTVNQCLTILFSKNYVSLERSPLDEAKTWSNRWKSGNVKSVNG